MGIFDYFRRSAPAIEAKESAASQTLVLNPGQPVWSNRDYAAFAREGYAQNVVVYQAINKVAEAIASVPVLLYRGEQEISGSPLLDLLRRPNPAQAFDEYVQSIVGYYLISGNLYQEKVLVGQVPKELYALRPDRMKVIPSSSGFPSAFQYEVGGRKHRWEFDAGNVKASAVWQTKAYNPLDDWYGLSPVEAASFAIDTHNGAMAWQKALLDNGARPSGALKVAGEGTLSDEAFSKLKAEIEQNYSGARNGGKPMLLEGGLEWVQMGMSPADMGIIEAKNAAARDICLAFGVPPQLLGIPGDNTYSNYQEARLAFWEDTVIPLMGVIYGAWNAWLAPHYGDGLELKPDLDQVPAIAEKRMTLWSMADASQDLTVNERRELKGYKPVTGGDAIMVPVNMLPLGDDTPLPEDTKAAAALAGYGGNVTHLDRKAK